MKRTKLAATISLSLILLFLVAIAGGIYTRISDANQARISDQVTWHKVICHIETETVKGHDRPYSARIVRSITFFDTILVEDVGTTPCGIISIKEVAK